MFGDEGTGVGAGGCGGGELCMWSIEVDGFAFLDGAGGWW